jgi:hypothetical protein
VFIIDNNNSLGEN